MIQQLKLARRHLERNGWVGPDKEPWCRDSRGRRVHHTDEGVYLFSVCGALQLAGAELGAALELLGRVVSPDRARYDDFVAQYSYDQVLGLQRQEADAVWPAPSPRRIEAEWWRLHAAAALAGDFMTFGGWLTEQGRTREDVLRVFTTAVLRSNREKRS